MKLLVNLPEVAQIKGSLGHSCAGQGLAEKSFPYSFAKSGQADLNAEQKKTIAAMIDAIKKAQKKEDE